MEKQRDEEFAERRERRRKQQEEEEETRRKKEEERRTREPQTAAGPENSQSQEGSGLAADEMDVVVSENSAVTAAGNVMESSRHSISDTVSRLTQDLANAIGGRVSGGPAGSQLAGLGADPGSGASGLLSSLSELLPSGSGAAVATSGAASTLNSVLQSLSASYHHHQGSGGAAAVMKESSQSVLKNAQQRLRHAMRRLFEVRGLADRTHPAGGPGWVHRHTVGTSTLLCMCTHNASKDVSLCPIAQTDVNTPPTALDRSAISRGSALNQCYHWLRCSSLGVKCVR